MHRTRQPYLFAALVCAAVLSGCASSTPPAPAAAAAAAAAPAPTVRKPAATPGLEQTALAVVDDAGKQFDAGNFNGAIKTLSGAQAIDFASTATQIRAHKLLAFSYCSIRKTAQCNAEFARILQLDANYQLPEAERFHPMWGPAFEAARKKSRSQS